MLYRVNQVVLIFRNSLGCIAFGQQYIYSLIFTPSNYQDSGLSSAVQTQLSSNVFRVSWNSILRAKCWAVLSLTSPNRDGVISNSTAICLNSCGNYRNGACRWFVCMWDILTWYTNDWCRMVYIVQMFSGSFFGTRVCVTGIDANAIYSLLLLGACFPWFRPACLASTLTPCTHCCFQAHVSRDSRQRVWHRR